MKEGGVAGVTRVFVVCVCVCVCVGVRCVDEDGVCGCVGVVWEGVVLRTIAIGVPCCKSDV